MIEDIGSLVTASFIGHLNAYVRLSSMPYRADRTLQVIHALLRKRSVSLILLSFAGVRPFSRSFSRQHTAHLYSRLPDGTVTNKRHHYGSSSKLGWSAHKRCSSLVAAMNMAVQCYGVVSRTAKSPKLGNLWDPATGLTSSGDRWGRKCMEAWSAFE